MYSQLESPCLTFRPSRTYQRGFGAVLAHACSLIKERKRHLGVPQGQKVPLSILRSVQFYRNTVPKKIQCQKIQCQQKDYFGKRLNHAKT